MLKPVDQHYRGAESIMRRLREAGHRALLAGGCVRDLLRGEAPQDYDIATDARPADVEALFPGTRSVGRQFGVSLVAMDGQAYEVAAFRTESGYSDGRHPDGVEFCSAEGDARRRDFTVNAMFWDPVEERLLDFTGGREDLAAGLLRAVGEPEERFREDHLRLLRAVRFAARLGFRIDEATRRALTFLAPLAVQVSAERLQEELRVILTDRARADALRLMDELGILEHVLPEVAAMKGCEQPANYHPEGDVFVHSLLSLEKLGPRPPFELAMAALLHDVGKPEASRARTGAAWFPEHDRLGAEITRSVCRRLRLSNAATERICWLVARHHYFMNARQMRDSTFRKLFAHPGFEQLAALHRADAMASCGILDDYDFVMARRVAMKPEDVLPPPLITGADLVALGWQPGPLFGEVLGAVRDAQLDGDVATREEALAMARRVAEELQSDDS